MHLRYLTDRHTWLSEPVSTYGLTHMNAIVALTGIRTGHLRLFLFPHRHHPTLLYHSPNKQTSEVPL